MSARYAITGQMGQRESLGEMGGHDIAEEENTLWALSS